MKRILTLLACCCGVLAAAAALSVAAFWDEAVERGERLRSTRALVERALRSRDSDRPLLFWLGDSTILRRPAVPTYPAILERRLSERVETRTLAIQGLDAYHAYAIAGPVLSLSPRVVAIVVNIRSFGTKYEDPRFGQLAALIPARELPRALRLPLHAGGVTIPGLMLARLGRLGGAERLGHFAEGLRRMFQEASFWKRLGEAPLVEAARPPARAAPAPASARELYCTVYDHPVHRWHPKVRMLGAAVSMLTRRGARVLLIAAPVPEALLAGCPWYDAATLAARFQVLREAAEAQGGSFLDLHGALDRAQFRDIFGHYTAAGAEALADRIQPWIERGLFDETSGARPGRGG